MTRDETVALFLECEAARGAARAAALGEGKDKWEADENAHQAAQAHWNAWAEALLAERKAMQVHGRWAAEKNPWGDLEPKNAETRIWMKKAAADFSGARFEQAPSLRAPAQGPGYTPRSDPEAASETLDAEAPRDDAPVKSEPPAQPIKIEGDHANFWGLMFPGTADFGSAAFSGNADFGSAAFFGYANFQSVAFSGNADFQSATFSGYASFDSAAFSGDADFESAAFSGDADFDSATFSGPADFRSAGFSGYAEFQDATFSGTADFQSAAFSGYANFQSAIFSGDADFRSATFSGPADFASAICGHRALFRWVTFGQGAFFNRVRFEAIASFSLAHFRQYAAFEASRFAADANFTAIRGDRGLGMSGARFEVVPDFIQAHFEEGPRLDNLEVGRKLPGLEDIKDEKRKKLGRRGRWHRCRLEKNPRYRRMFEAMSKDSDLRNIPARWRALKRLAIQGHDTEREREFHARETRSQRFTEDWPLPLAFWRGKAWVDFFRFWFGAFYGLFSDFGRSPIRPAAFWLAAVVLGAMFYVSQSPEIVASRHEMQAKGASSVSAAASNAWRAWLTDRRPCHAGQEAPPKDKNGNTPVYVGALSPSLQSGTDLANEAWHLAFRNAFIVLDGSGEAAHRTYGCLYGVELYGGGNPLAVVPSAVSTVSAAQKLFSALMIFLFGLALRNMLKMK